MNVKPAFFLKIILHSVCYAALEIDGKNKLGNWIKGTVYRDHFQCALPMRDDVTM